MSEPSPTAASEKFGGRFVPETLVPACEELEVAFRDAWIDPTFRAELDELLQNYAGRPSALTECRNLGESLGMRVLLKREDLNHTGSHKINNVLGGSPPPWECAETLSPRRAPAALGGATATRRPARPRLQGYGCRRRQRRRSRLPMKFLGLR